MPAHLRLSGEKLSLTDQREKFLYRFSSLRNLMMLCVNFRYKRVSGADNEENTGEVSR